MKRALAGVLLLSGLFFAPWALVFAGAVFFTAVFPWFLEALLVGSVAAVMADAALWKIFAILSSALLVQEYMKPSISFEKRFASLGLLWLAGLFVFVFFFLVLI